MSAAEMPEECALCGIHIREPYRTVWSNDRVVVVVNFEPVKRGHVMVMPVKHRRNLRDLNEAEAIALNAAVDRCTEGIGRLLGVSTLVALNGWGFRSQEHLHVHVLPSTKPLRGLFTAAEGTPDRERAPDQLLADMADQLRPIFG